MRFSVLPRYGKSLAPMCMGALAFATGCGGGDYYFVNDIKGAGDTILLEVIYTCGDVDISWDGSFGEPPHYHIELGIKHDAHGDDCDEDPREIPFDVGSIKRSFRERHPWPTPLALRVAPYEEEQGAICLSNLFQDEPFKGKRCK